MSSVATSALGDETEKDVLPWLKLAEDLRVLKLDVDLNMPQICVMGDQSSGTVDIYLFESLSYFIYISYKTFSILPSSSTSYSMTNSGKSSVLEALSGIPFPRGSGLVTRCPIRMVMKRARAGEEWCARVSTSVDPTVHTVRSIPELSVLLDRLMNALCAGSSNFSTESVIIDLVSPDACDLTVVDLPGIIRTVTAGQNVSVIEQVNRMIKSYLMDKRTIILAVIPANQDIATVDILERAQGVDPTGERTIGVLTKTDLVGPGNEDEVMAVANNVRKPLALGYVMVKNRSQKDIAENVTTAKSREMEKAFFATHAVFRKLNVDLYGVTVLSKKLTNLLVSRIKSELAPMRLEVERQLSEVRSQLRVLPSSFATPKSASDRQKLLVSIVQEYVRHLSDCIRGEYRDRIMVRHTELRMFTIALGKFEEFKTAVNDSAPRFKDDDFIQLLASQIDQLRGRELPGFMSSQAFYMCMSQYVDIWQDPAVQLVRDVEQVAKEVSMKLADILLVQYPGLRYALQTVTEKILMENADKTIEKLSDCISREKDPFTLNDFLQQWVNKIRFDRFSSAVDNVFDNAKNPATNWGGLKEEVYSGMRHWYRSTHSVSAQASAQDMSAIMEAYWHLAAKRFIDSCCMFTDNDVLGKLPTAVQDEMYQFIKDDNKLQVK